MLPRLLAATGVITARMNIVVVVPTFNEAENIETLVAELLALGGIYRQTYDVQFADREDAVPAQREVSTGE